MRRLADGVRRSAASTYAEPVPVESNDELAALARAFNEAGATVRQHFKDVQAREQTLRQFVADTTHDVAMPITVLQGHLSRLDARLAAQSGGSVDARRDLDAAVKEVHYMASLLRNLAVATKLGEASVPLVVSPVDVCELVERVVARHQPLARASGVDLDFAVPGAPLVLHTDATLLEQAVSNLTDNAIRYNRAGGHVAVVLDAVGPGGIALTVTDDGPGVSAEELSSLTVRWFRGSDARTRRPDGKGLGLAIAAEACERLGLTLAFRRPVDGGLEAAIASVPDRAGTP
jgi:signal transduction histidine kinase